MSKRKKLRTSGEVRSLKPPKNPRLGDCVRSPPDPKLGHSHHFEGSEGSLVPIPATEHSTEEPGQAVTSSPDEEAGSPSQRLRQPGKEPAVLPPSQNSLGRFVPQFAKSRKTLTSKAGTREEDVGSGASSLETLAEPRALPAGSLSLEELPGLALQEIGEPGGQVQAGGTCPGQSSQSFGNPVPSIGDSQPVVSPEGDPEYPTSQRASQESLLEQRTRMSEGGGVGYHRSEAEGVGADLLREPQEEEEDIPGSPAPAPGSGLTQALGPATPLLDPGSAPQGLSEPRQTPSGPSGEEQRHNPGHVSDEAVVPADVSTDPPELELRALEVARPDGQADAEFPAFASRKAPDGGRSGTLPACRPLARETIADREEAGQENEPSSEAPVGPAASLALTFGNQEPTVGAGDSSLQALETGPGVHQEQVPSPDQEAAELGSQSHVQDLEGLSLSFQAANLLEHREAADSPPQDTQACRDTHRDSPGLLELPPGSADQPVWEGYLAMELDFLPDSQIQEALDAPDFEAPPEQLFPVGSRPGPGWPGLSPRAHGDAASVTEAQTRTCVGAKGCEAPRMEDATDTVRGLVVELSNLNRLIMSTYRDLEAFRRLHHQRKAKPTGKAPTAHPSKGTGAVPRGQQRWRDL
ncbi:uncharacterized protein C19orf57 homolog [Tupaia chinensis]|uniref:uncharacterized protein C19orf57 homolog n=1 Tax=Tupaia chinensis TaxID=246437 RepID=UPI0003C8E492|nr:uncharacterized protein C19orf57 homolog [Tupaia chinensis]